MRLYDEEERIDTQVQSVNFKGYLMLQTLTIGILILKIYLLHISMISISTELIILLGGNLYILIKAFLLRVNLVDFLKGRDEFNLIFRNKIFSQAFYLCFIAIGVMTMLFLLLDRIDLCYYELIEFFIPSIYVTYKSVKEGLLLNRVKTSRKKYKLVVYIIICITYTLGTNWEFLKTDKSLIVKIGGIAISILGYMFFVAIPINFSVKVLAKKAKKNADRLSD